LIELHAEVLHVEPGKEYEITLGNSISLYRSNIDSPSSVEMPNS
jgi:hypothetical protein